MSATNMNKKTETDWDALEAMTDANIDVSDIPPLTDGFFSRARLVAPKTQSTVELDDDVLKWFKSHSRNYKEQINRVLRQYIQVQEK
jgi:uncharacterized protein (DUF4415 family)